MPHTYRAPRLLDFEDLAIIADLAAAGALFAYRRPARSLLLFEIIAEVAAGNAIMFPVVIAEARSWLIEAGRDLPSVELAALTKPHLLI